MATVPEIDQSILDYKTKTFNDYMEGINTELADMDKIMNKELYESNRPDSIINRVFADIFGVIGLYLMLFILSDFTRTILTGSGLFGVKWIFWGPYYYLTKAPLLTRMWESKKFLKDLSEVEGDADFAWPENQSCYAIGQTYETNCKDHTTRNHPIRDKMGDGLDWFIRHTIGKHFNGIFGSDNCEDQGTTISHDCAIDKVNALFAAYNGFCDLYPTLIFHRATSPNWPNGSSNDGGETYWNDFERAAYNVYFEGYNMIFDTGSSLHTSTDWPTNVIQGYDSVSFYCYNANRAWGLGNYAGGTDDFGYLNWGYIPSWYPSQGWYDTNTPEYKEQQMYFQLNYKDHVYDT